MEAHIGAPILHGDRRGDVERLDSSKSSLIGSLEVAPLKNGEVEAKTAFLVYRPRLETDHQLLSGCREDVLHKVNGAWTVRRRAIVLDANVPLAKNLSVFL